MATFLSKIKNAGNNSTVSVNIFNIIVRYGHMIRGKRPGVAKSLEQKFAEWNAKDPSVHYHVDIGFPPKPVNKNVESKSRLQHLNTIRKNAELEKLAREKKLHVDLNEVHRDWLNTCGPYQVQRIAAHYGVYQHLFGDAYFVPHNSLDIRYECEQVSDDNDSDSVSFHPVYYGNVLKPSNAKKQPFVDYESDDNSLWSLILTNPDGHLTQNNAEYVHWFVGNIRGNNVSKGEVIVDYLQPFPPKGTGYHRHIFVLYKQNKLMDYSSFKRSIPCLNLTERTFSTLDFYKDRQDDLTPAGLAFFQADWDSSLTHFYHNTLQMREPIFEYDFPAPYIKKQTWFPIRQSFNRYLDRNKDERDVRARYFKEKLKEINPFEPPKPRVPYPNAEPLAHSVPSWLKEEIRRKRLGWGRINDV